MAFKLEDTNRYFLPGTNDRFLHLATVANGFKEYICMNDQLTNKTYIEEITGGHLEFISDDLLAEALHKFLIDKKVLEMSKPTLPDDIWLKDPKKR